LGRSSGKILIVEDSPMQATLLRRILKRENYETFAAKDGAEGYDMACEEKPILVITDINMPGMDGYELCQKIKKNAELPNIPVILVTSLLNPEDLIRGIEVGADNYITKPYNADTLLNKVNELIQHPLPPVRENQSEPIEFDGNQYNIRASREHILNFLITTYENISQQNQKLTQLHEDLKEANEQLEMSQEETKDLLYNTLPQPVADNLMAYGKVRPERYDDVTILFTDFIDFTQATENMDPQDLVETLEYYFSYFDEVTEQYGLEKIKTIGDSYMMAGGVPERNTTHALDSVLAAMDIMHYMNQKKEEADSNAWWPIRIGINTGPVVAGIIGEKRFAYDVWGNSVNLASRMESHGQPGSVNISENTFQQVREFFDCKAHHEVEVKGVGEITIYTVQGLKKEWRKGGKSFATNAAFDEKYQLLQRQEAE